MTAADFAAAGFVDERFHYFIALIKRLVPAPSRPGPRNPGYEAQGQEYRAKKRTSSKKHDAL